MNAGLVITQFQERWMRFPPGLVQGWDLKDSHHKMTKLVVLKYERISECL